MSGKRTKALRRQFLLETGHAPVTETKTEIGAFVRSVWSKVARKRVKERVPQRVVIYARNEFRRFKRAGGRTAAQIAADWAGFLARRRAHAAEVERNYECIQDGRKRKAA
jgi:hypothetical protein